MTSPKGRILCTEDGADTRDLLILSLTIAGYDVSCTVSAHTAIERLKSEKFDLCLVDNWMTGTSGEDLCKKIREFDNTTPILFYSGAAYPADKECARAAGAQGYIVKPVTDDHLVAKSCESFPNQDWLRQ
jgi:DNA-binding response OmpR family regulator